MGSTSTKLVTDDSLGGMCCQQENNNSKVKLVMKPHSVPTQTECANSTTPRRLRSNPMASSVIKPYRKNGEFAEPEDKLDQNLIDRQFFHLSPNIASLLFLDF